MSSFETHKEPETGDIVLAVRITQRDLHNAYMLPMPKDSKASTILLFAAKLFEGIERKADELEKVGLPK